MRVEYELVDWIGQIGEEKKGTTKSLCLISWDDKPAKLDVRAWHKIKPGRPGYGGNCCNEIPGKGITLTDDEAKDLLDLLQKYFDREEA